MSLFLFDALDIHNAEPGFYSKPAPHIFGGRTGWFQPSITNHQKVQLSIKAKFIIVLLFAAISLVGFMVKLPWVFRHHDKELHTIFYFLAAAVLNVLFSKRNLLMHALIFAVLYMGSVFIEYVQAWSNQFFKKRIHSRFDPEDVTANTQGLVAFSVLWLLYLVLYWLWNVAQQKERQAAAMEIKDENNPAT